MKPIREKIKDKPMLGWALFLVTIVVVFLLGLLASSVMERRAEAVFAYTPKVEHAPTEPRNEVWGQNFPKQYQSGGMAHAILGFKVISVKNIVVWHMTIVTRCNFSVCTMVPGGVLRSHNVAIHTCFWIIGQIGMRP